MASRLAEFRQAARGLRRTPTIAVSAILCLALGIGTTTAVASAVARALLDPLPFRDPDGLVAVHRVTPHSGPNGTWPNSLPNYRDLAERTRTLQPLAAMTTGTALVTLRTEAVQAPQLYVTGNLFAMLGARALRGRLLLESDAAPGQPPVAVVSADFWRTRLGADERVVGNLLLVDGQPTTVVGIAEPELRIPHGGRVMRADVWMPLVVAPGATPDRRSNFLFLLGRRAPGVTTDAVDSEIRTLFARIVEENPVLRGEGIRVAPLQAENVGTVRKPLLIVFGAAALVLLIACTNVAALLLARGVQRRRELAIRTALGAARADTVRLALTESALVTGIGTAIGLLLAKAGVATIGALASARLPQLRGIDLDARVLAFALVLALLVALVCGIVPAWRGASVDPQEALGGNRGTSAGRAHHRALRLLVAGEIAMSLVLLISASLLLRTFASLIGGDPGFAAGRMLSLKVTLSPQRYADRPSARAFLLPALDAIRAVPGVQGAGAISVIPYDSWGNNGNVRYEGVPGDDPTRLPIAERRQVSPSFFEATGQRLLAGRLLGPADDEKAPYAVVVNEALVERDFTGKDPVGKRFHISDSTFGTIVGVVSDIRNGGPFSPPLPEMYGSYLQASPNASGFGIMVRVQGGDPTAVAPQVRAAIAAVDPSAAVADVAGMREVVGRSLGSPRFYLSLIGAFSVVAVVLASAGLYGILSYAVAQRTREFGIRLALGSQPARLVRMVTGQGVRLVLGGLVVGLVGAVGATRLMGSMLYGLSPLDLGAWIAGTLLLLLIGVGAALVPAVRATRVDPLRAIQTE